jgi:hypothetical protein
MEMPSMYLIGYVVDIMLKIKMPTSVPMVEPRLSTLGPVLQYYAKLNLNALFLKLLGSQEAVVIMSGKVASDIRTACWQSDT